MPIDPPADAPKMSFTFRTELLSPRELQLLSFVVVALFEASTNAQQWAGVASDTATMDVANRLTELLQRHFPDLDPKLRTMLHPV